jgi:uncharacterized membrane protein
MKAFLKTTIVGGVLFLLPVALVLLVLGHAMRLARKVAEPIASHLELERLGHFEIIGTVTIVAVLVLVLVSFGAGLIARTGTGKRISQWFENSILGGLPQYQMMKSMAEGLAEVEGASGAKPVLVSIEDGWQIGYLLEPVADGWVAVFVPQAPTPMSGNVMYLPAERVRPLGISMVQAMQIVKHIGAGSSAALRGIDLRLPAGA